MSKFLGNARFAEIRVLIGLVILVLAMLAAVDSPSKALAREGLDPSSVNTLSVEESNDLRDEMKHRGISEGDQEKIIDKIQRGELPDADNPEMSPVRSYVSPEKESVEVLIFEDGSVAYSSVGEGEGLDTVGKGQARSTVSSEQCRKYRYNGGWERWDGCLIQYNGIAFHYSFRANVSLPYKSSGRGIIRNVWEPTVWRAVGHTVQNSNVSIIQSWENKSNRTPARAQMRATLQVAKIFSTKTIALDLEIRGRGVRIIPTM